MRSVCLLFVKGGHRLTTFTLGKQPISFYKGVYLTKPCSNIPKVNLDFRLKTLFVANDKVSIIYYIVALFCQLVKVYSLYYIQCRFLSHSAYLSLIGD